MNHILEEVKKQGDIIKAKLSFINTKDQIRLAFTRYLSVFHPHFIVWVSAMQNSVRSPIAKYAAEDNILLELVENHQDMLLNFMAQINITPSFKEYLNLKHDINLINRVNIYGVKAKMGVGPATVIYTLEELSKIFIPWMEKAAKKMGATDFTYTRNHGEADKQHSHLAYEASVAEYKNETNYTYEHNLAYQAVVHLLHNIFQNNKKEK